MKIHTIIIFKLKKHLIIHTVTHNLRCTKNHRKIQLDKTNY